MGWFFRGHAGPSYANVSLENALHTGEVHGWGAGLGLSAGVWLGQRCVLSGEVFSATHLGVAVVGDALGPPAGSATATLFAAGAGITYVVGDEQPGDAVSISAALMLSKLRVVEQPSALLITGGNLTPTLQLGLAREWPLAPGWGMGAAVRVTFAGGGDDVLGLDYSTTATTFSLSISYD
jgi:hypothetical protein